MHLERIVHPKAPLSLSRSLSWAGVVLALVLLSTGCASGSVQEARMDQARDAGLPQQLAAEQATRTVERYFPATATPSATKAPRPALGDLVMTFGFRPDGTPDGSYESVPAGAGTVYAAQVRGVVTDRWGNDVAAPELTVDPGAADRWIALPIGLPADLAPGEYGVFVFVDGQMLGSLAFGVTGAGSSAQLLPEQPANPQVIGTFYPPGSGPVEGAVTPTVVTNTEGT
jgi:hypothetical protein